MRKNLLRKRLFDLAVGVLSIPAWVPAILVCALVLFLKEGRPVFYASERRVHRKRSRRITKFRTMVRDAERIANRDTVPIANTCFLNIPQDSPLYTPLGRTMERFALTELPQLLHVLAGHMSLVGNRPLPENVIAALLKRYPYAEDRLSLCAGMTGPVQLVGRDNLSDRDRIALEIGYCIVARSCYTMRLDFLLLLHTVLIAVGIEGVMDVPRVRQMMIAAVRRPQWVCRVLGGEQRSFRRYPSDAMVELFQPGTRRRQSVLPAIDMGYGGLSLSGTLPRGSVVELKLADDASEPPFCGKVVWTHDHEGHSKSGVEFLDPPALGRNFVSLLGLSHGRFPPTEPNAARVA